MVNICHNMADAAKRYGAEGNYVVGANIAGFAESCRCNDCSGNCVKNRSKDSLKTYVKQNRKPVQCAPAF